MKRPLSTENLTTPKRRRISDSLFDDFDLQRTAIDIFENGTDGSGYLSGRIYMTWPPTKNKRKTIFETKSEQAGSKPLVHRFEVEFTGVCAEFFEQLDFKTHDEVMLALKGVVVGKTTSEARACNLNMKLQFVEGVLIKIIKRRAASEATNEIIDTWELKQPDWFSSPQNLSSNEIAEAADWLPIRHQADRGSLSVSHQAPTSDLNGPSRVLLATNRTLSPSPQNEALQLNTAHLPETNSSIATAGPQPGPSSGTAPINPPTLRISKAEQRRQAKAKKAAKRGITHSAPSTNTVVTPQITSDLSLGNGRVIGPPKIQPIVSVESAILAPQSQETSSALTTSQSKISSTLDLKAGLTTVSGNKYTALNKLNAGEIVHMIGVVTQTTAPSKTKSGEWSCNLIIVDPSNVIIEKFGGAEGFKVNCFTKKYEEWLPQPNAGEVLILRNVKVASWNGGLNGVGYGDKLQWASYSPTKKKICHRDLRDAPASEGLAGGYGHIFTPFFHPGESEIEYCSKISDWWNEVRHKRGEVVGEENGVNHYVPRTSYVERQHRLISEAGPDVPPRGFFDCTIEVLHGYMNHMNQHSVYSLYVTDYTKHPSVSPVTAKWCPPGLNDFVLKVEAWDQATNITAGMLAGEYYSINNIRMKVSMGGYLEGHMSQAKIKKLEETDAEWNKHLKSLLQRKETWQSGNPENLNSFEFRLIKDAVEDEYFNCAVKVLHAVHEGEGTSCLYVTDYTFREELQSLILKESWAADLRGGIVKITLWDSQVEMSKSIEPGAYYMIDKLRLRTSKTGRQFQGRLGGIESLVKKFNPRKENDKLNGLRQREKDWENNKLIQDGKHRLSSSPKIRTTHSNKRKCTSIEDLIGNQKCPNKFRIEARIIDFYPLDLVDCVLTHCTNCKNDLPKTHRSCFECNDTEYEYRRYIYQLFFRLQDEHGSQLHVSANDDCPLFYGLERTDLRANRPAYDALCARLNPLIGNLVKVHEEMKQDSIVIPESPILTLIINSWEVDGERAYCLAELEQGELG